MALYYIGSFPPPEGGVTIKNKNLLLALQQQPETASIIPVDFSRIKKKDWKMIALLFHALTAKDSTFVIGLAGRRYRKYFIELTNRINHSAMERSILILMGGLAAQDIVSDPKLCRSASHFRKIYAESPGMVRQLQAAGLNAGCYPNGRFRPTREFSGQAQGVETSAKAEQTADETPAKAERTADETPAKAERTAAGTHAKAERIVTGIPEKVLRHRNHPLQAVYFSLISEPKGAGRVLRAAEQQPEIRFTFYGPIAPEYKTRFQTMVHQLPNVRYRGIFHGDTEAICRELSGYDVLLLPTSWKAEGVPGILVEGKFAGLAEIVSNHAFNAEIVEDGVDGIVLRENTPEKLAEALQQLDQNRTLLGQMKQESRNSAGQYEIEHYLPEIIRQLFALGKL